MTFKGNDEALFTAGYLIQTWNELTGFLLKHPDKLVQSQLNYYQAYFNLCQEFSNYQPGQENNISLDDKRFKHTEWQKNLVNNFIKRSYQLLAQHTDLLSNELNIQDKKLLQKFRFYSRQFVDAAAPSNFVNINPEVVSKTMETNGLNLLEGFKQFQEDLASGQGHFKINLTDTSQFEIGKNIACTPGKVIYQNDLMQLIQYCPTTAKIHTTPLLIIPPWINKYYILDLQPENSFVKWVVDQGYTVFMISWVNPDHRHKEKEFSDYLHEGPLAALNVIKKVTKNKNINVLGYCIGGTLLSCLLSYIAQKKIAVNIASATFLTTLLDFSEPGEMGTFIDDTQINMLEEYMLKKGYLDGYVLASVFNALRANDLIWYAFINNYLKGQKPKPFDLLYWNNDATNIPAKTHSFYLRNMYLNNLLIESGKVKMNGLPMDLSLIKTPSYFLAAYDDHIAPWQSCYQSQHILPKSTKFVLAASGHVAGVVNPPHKEKYGYWTNKSKPKMADKFLATSTYHEGSWWLDWQTWLQKYAGELIANDHHRVNSNMIIEDAPGSYVKVKLTETA